MKLNKVHGGSETADQGNSTLAGPSTAGAQHPTPHSSTLLGGRLKQARPQPGHQGSESLRGTEVREVGVLQGLLC